MTDGLKHVVHRRVHLERSQPLARRSKVGRFLEKKKDYKVRAERYHVMERRIHDLAAKARFRNEDEFNFKMVHGKLGEDGVVILPTEKAVAERKLNRKGQFKKAISGIDQNRFVLKHRLNVKGQKLKDTIAENAAILAETKTHKTFSDSDSSQLDSDEGEDMVNDEENTKEREHNDVSRRYKGNSSQTNKKVKKNKQQKGASSTKAVQDHLKIVSEKIHDTQNDVRLQQGLEDERNLRTALYKRRHVTRVPNSNTRYFPFERQK